MYVANVILFSCILCEVYGNVLIFNFNVESCKVSAQQFTFVKSNFLEISENEKQDGGTLVTLLKHTSISGQGVLNTSHSWLQNWKKIVNIDD